MPSPESRSARVGIAYMIAAIFVLNCLDASSKYLANALPLALMVWSRFVGHTVCALGVGLPRRGGALFRTSNLPLQIARGCCLGVMSLLFFFSLRTLPLPIATALLFLSPIGTTLLARWLLKESVSRFTWAALALGFVGVVMVVQPGGAVDLRGVGFAFAAALCNSVYQMLTRHMALQDAPESQLFYTGLAGTVALTVTLPWWWQPVSPSGVQLTVLLALGVLGALGHWLLILAYKNAAASVVSPWVYLQLVWALLLGGLLFGDRLNALGLAGMGVIALAPQLTRFQRTRSA